MLNSIARTRTRIIIITSKLLTKPSLTFTCFFQQLGQSITPPRSKCPSSLGHVVNGLIIKTLKIRVRPLPNNNKTQIFPRCNVQIVLATDLAHGFEYVARFTASTNTKGGRRASIVPDMGREGSISAGIGGQLGAGGVPGAVAQAGKDPLQAQILLMQMVIKASAV